ncbi:hypothetical protein DSUL_20333 [Desulfovibrionales bacterium]
MMSARYAVDLVKIISAVREYYLPEMTHSNGKTGKNILPHNADKESTKESAL